MTAEIVNSGIFTTWLSLPRDEEWQSKAIVYLIAANVAWWFLLFIGSNYHPLPSSLTKTLK
jgi:hypothetical protein